MFSGCPSVRPSVRSLKYPLLTCTWVRWSTRPTVTVLRHVRPSVPLSVRLSGEVSGHLPENAWRDWPEILHADVSWPSSELISLWPWSVDFYTPVFRRDVLWYGAVRPSVRSSVRPTVSTKKHRCKWRIFFKFCTQVCLGVPSINLLFVLSYLIKYAHNSIISDFSIFGIHRVIFKVRVFKFCTFWELIIFLDISSVFYRIPIWLFFTIILTIHLLISLGTLLARENIEGTFCFFSNSVCRCS